MSGNNDESAPDVAYALDTNSISHMWRSYYRDIFPGFWERFDELARVATVVSVRAVRAELANDGRVARSVGYLENLNPRFFAAPTANERVLVSEMAVNPRLSSAASRWASKDNADADPYLIAKARTSNVHTTVVTEESQDPIRSSGIPYVSRYYGVACINLHEMLRRLGWRF